MPNGMYGGVRGERKSPLLDCNSPGYMKNVLNPLLLTKYKIRYFYLS